MIFRAVLLLLALGLISVVTAAPAPPKGSAMVTHAVKLKSVLPPNRATLPVEVTFGGVGHPYERDGGWGVNIAVQIPGHGTRTRVLSCVPGATVTYLLDGVVVNSPPPVLVDFCAYLIKTYGPVVQTADNKVGDLTKSPVMQAIFAKP